MVKNPLLITIGALFSIGAQAGNADVLDTQDLLVPVSSQFNNFILTLGISTANQKLTQTAIKDWKFNESFGIQYAFNNYMFVGATADLMRHSSFGYKVDGGFEIPTNYLTPYIQLTYNADHADSNDSRKKTDSIDYSIGTTISAPWLHGISLLAELKDPIKKDESARLGVGYNFTKSMSVGVDYTMSFKDDYNSMGLEMDYAFQ